MELGSALGLATPRGSRFDPRALPGLQFLYDHKSERRANADGTGSLVTTNGTNFKWWQDRGPNGLHVSEATGFPSLTVNGSDRVSRFVGKLLSCAWSPGAIAGDYSYHALIRRQDDGTGGTLAFHAATNTDFFASSWTQGGQVVPGSSQFGSEWLGKSTKATLISQVRSGGTVTTYVDGNPVQTLANTTSFSPDVIQVGRLNLTIYSNIFLSTLAFATAAHSQGQVVAYRNWLREQLPTEYGRSSNLLIYMGNSLGTAFYVSPNTALMAKVHSGGYAPSLTHWLNASIGSKTTQQMLGDYATRIVPLAGATSGRTVIFLWEGTNDMLLNNIGGATAAANVFALVQALRAAISNCRVVVGTCIDRYSLGSAGTVTAQKAAFNGALLNSGNQSAYGYTVADFTGVAEASADDAHLSTTYFADGGALGTHLNAAGYDLIKSIVGAAVEAALAS